MKKLNLIIVFAALFCLTAFSNASATGILAGEWGMGQFDKIVQVSLDDIFVDPGITLDAYYTETHANAIGSTYDGAIFDQWQVIFDASGKQVTTQGPNLDVLLWFYSFNTAYEDTPFSFEFYAYLDSRLIDWATITYDGGTHGAAGLDSPLSNMDNFSFITHNTTPVPEPATMFLLGFGLLGVAGLRKMVKK